MFTPLCNLHKLWNYFFIIFLFLLSLMLIKLTNFQATASSSHSPIAGNLEPSPFFIYLLPIKHFILQFIALHKLQLYPDYITSCISYNLMYFLLPLPFFYQPLMSRYQDPSHWNPVLSLPSSWFAVVSQAQYQSLALSFSLNGDLNRQIFIEHALYFRYWDPMLYL